MVFCWNDEKIDVLYLTTPAATQIRSYRVKCG